MLNLSTPNCWQHIDPSNGLLFPWYVKSFLDELATWDLKEKVVLEIGMGASTLWWQSRVFKLYAFETNEEWYQAIEKYLDCNITLPFLYESARIKNVMPSHNGFDIAIIDCEPLWLRDESVKLALDCLKSGGKLIFDNWMQPSLGWLPSKQTQELLLSMDHKIYHQPGHPDWKTLVVTT